MIKFSSLAPSNEALQFIDTRLASPEYRGSESSQHNRYTIQEFIEILKILNKYAPNSKNLVNTELLRMRTQDISKTPTTLPEWRDWEKFCYEVNSKIQKGDQDSIRKNYWPDFHRGGVINRFNKKEELLGGWDGGGKYYVKISETGKRFIDESKSLLDQQIFFAKYINNLMGNYVDITADVLDALKELRDEKYKIGRSLIQDRIYFYEYAFFVSALLSKDPKFNISSIEECVAYIIKFRQINLTLKKHFAIQFKESFQPKNFTGTKVDKRDAHNFNNKFQQIFSLLNQTAYFAVAGGYKFISYRSSIKEDEYGEKKNKLRNLDEKHEYHKFHKTVKTLGFQMDHIVPFSWAESIHHNKIIDDHKNFLYIDGKSHGIKTQQSSKHCILSPGRGDNLILKDATGDEIFLEYGVDVLYDPSNLKTMLDWNKKLNETL